MPQKRKVITSTSPDVTIKKARTSTSPEPDKENNDVMIVVQ